MSERVTALYQSARSWYFLEPENARKRAICHI